MSDNDLDIDEIIRKIGSLSLTNVAYIHLPNELCKCLYMLELIGATEDKIYFSVNRVKNK